jgi:hypothetical protein
MMNYSKDSLSDSRDQLNKRASAEFDSRELLRPQQSFTNSG